MTDKEKFDACMAIIEACNNRRQAREAFEWKLSIAFWTLIVLATEFLSRTDTTVTGLYWYWRLLTALIVLAIYAVFALGLARAHKRDGDRSYHYHRQATALLHISSSTFVVERFPKDEVEKIEGPCWKEVRKFWCEMLKCETFKELLTAYGQLFQLGTTAFLLAAFCILA